jgi:hypothetical protein
VPVTETAELSGITPAAPSFNVPDVIVVEPYAFEVLDKINVDVAF